MIRQATALILMLAAPLAAQEPHGALRIGGDVWTSGETAVIDTPDADDVFAAGGRVEIAAPVAGTALLAGRRVTADAPIGGDLFAAGADVTVAAPVAGDATLAGYDVDVTAEIGANLRAAGRNVHVAAPVAGTALLAGATVRLDAAVAGDAVVTAGTLDFGPDARIGGRLTLYEDTPHAIPESVLPTDRIDRRPHDPGDFGPGPAPGWLALGSGFLFGIVLVALLAAIVASAAPQGLAELRRIAGARPVRTFCVGFLALAALIGASVLATISLIGLLAAPFLLLAAVLLCALGYFIGVYLVGLLVWDRLGQLAPDSFPERALAALIGACLVGLIALVPFLGWLFLLVLTLTGLGALTDAWLRPEFRA